MDLRLLRAARENHRVAAPARVSFDVDSADDRLEFRLFDGHVLHAVPVAGLPDEQVRACDVAVEAEARRRPIHGRELGPVELRALDRLAEAQHERPIASVLALDALHVAS